MITGLVEETYESISGMIRITPCRHFTELSSKAGAEVYLKLENLQLSGSFKIRGVAAKVFSLDPAEKGKSFIAASTGNHGAAFSHVMNELGLKGKLFLPRNVSPAKLKAIQESRLDYELLGDDIVETEVHARSYAREFGRIFIPPYNDMAVVAGQGTIAMELVTQLEGFDAVLLPVGGGGLVSGVGGYLKELNPEVEIIGCQPANSPVMSESIKAGVILDRESIPTFSDGTAGGIEPGAVTFELCGRYVDDFILLEEGEIAEAIRFVYEYENMLIEGAAALSVAAVLKRREYFAGRRIVCLVTGSRIDMEFFRRITG